MISRINLKEISLLIILFIVLFTSFTDPDVWWHLKNGQLIFETHSFPVQDTFSHTFYGYEWADSYWLSDVIIYLLWFVGGPWFPPLVLSLLLSLFYVLSTKFICKSFIPRLCSLFTVSICMIAFNVVVRPMVFSVIFLSLVWFILMYKNLNKFLVLFPLLFLLWANLHADFVIGLSIFAFFVFTRLIEVIRKVSSSRSFMIPAFVFFLSVLATFVNPYGTLLHKTLLQEALMMPSSSTNIVEFLPVSWDLDRGMYAYSILFMALVLIGVINRPFAPSVVRTNFAYIVILITTALSVLSVYYLRPLAIFSLPLLYELFNAVIKKLNLDMKSIHLIMRTNIGAILASLFVMFAIRFAYNFSASWDLESATRESNISSSAISYIRSAKLSGNVFNSYRYGSYMMMFLPEHKVFIDGRMPAWKRGDFAVLETYVKVSRAQDSGFVDSTFERFNISWVYLDKKDNKPLVDYLVSKPGWTQVYEDGLSVILVRSYTQMSSPS